MRRILMILTVAALMTTMLALSAVPAFAAEATWDEEERGEPGKFSFQLILDGEGEAPPEEMDAEDVLFVLF